MRTALLLILLYLIFTTSSQAQTNLQEEYTRAKLMGLTLQDPLDFDIAPDGKIYVLDYFNIKVFSPQGELLKELFLDGNFTGFGIATDNQGHFFVSRNRNEVCKYTAEGELVMCFGSAGNAPGQFNSPWGIDIDNEGNIYVADAGNYRVQKFDSQGNILQVYDSLQTNHGEYIEPYRIKLDANNSLNILGVHWLKRIKQDGTPDLLINGAFIEDVAFDAANNIYLSASPLQDGQYITKYSYDGDTLANYLTEGTESGHLSGFSTRLSTDPDKNLWVMEFTSASLKGRVHKLTPDFDFELTFGDAGADNKSKISINYPMHFDGTGNYYSQEDGKLSLFDSNGHHIRTFGGTGDKDFFPNPIKEFSFDSQGAIYVIADDVKGVVHKFTPTGEYVTSLLAQPLLPDGSSFFPDDILFDRIDNMYLLKEGRCLKYSSTGEFIGDFVFDLQHASNGATYPSRNIVIDALGFFYFVHDYQVKKYDQTGALVAQFEALSPGASYLSGGSMIAIDDMGFIYITDRIEDKLVIKKYSQSGGLVAIINNKYRLNGNPSLYDMNVSRDGSTIWLALKGFSHFNNILVYQNKNSPSISSSITGTIYADSNLNCVQDEGDSGIENALVVATPGPYYGRTNRYGQFNLHVPSGVYSVEQVISDQNGRKSRQICPSNTENNVIDFSETEGARASINFANQVTLTPHLSVSVSSTRRRRCFESTTTVRYENSGFAPAPDAKVYLQLPAEVEMLSADKAYTRLPESTFEFAVGDLAAGQSGTITLQDIVKCGDESVRGRTVCTRAWITPSNNAPSKPTPTVTITGRCDAGSGRIRFVIKNSGKADMEQYEQFRKFVDGSLASKEQFRLAAGDSMVLWVPSMGYTWRMEADQPEGNGDNKIASVTIEACTDANAGTTVSSGFVNILPTDDEEAEVSEECLMIIDSYDPNDKLVTPVGRTAEHYTSTNTELKYKIRFQNTGTDVAYRVVVVDTLSEYLDLSTLQVGAASHTHRFEVSGKGRPVLTWTFDNILLPDSTANEPGSHGYIQFSIKPKADLPEKTSIENFADIFFDYNSPVRTNVTVNRIYDMPLVVDEAVRVNLEDVLATPAIAAFEPASGKFGTEITITGKRFASDATANKVYLNGKAATVVSATNSELRVLVPTGAATGALKVITPDGGVTASEIFEVYQPPLLSSFSPAEGTAGQTVTLQGQNLRISQLPEVYLGAQQCAVSMAGTGELQVVVPSGAATGAFRISTEGGEAQSSQTYRVWQQPAITALSKHTDRAGSELRITGADFAEQAARNKVYFGQAEATVLQATASSLLVEIPSTAGAGKVKVITPGGEVLSDQTFELIPAPVLVQMHPAKGSVGNVVELRGQHFLTSSKQDTVSFNGIKAVVLSASPELFKVQVPRGVSTGKVEIKGVGGAALSSQDFVVEDLSLAESVIISPNPSDGSFALDLHRADFEVQRLQVYSSLGQVVLEQSITTPRPDILQVQLRKSQSGIYLLRLHTDRGLLTLKLYVR